jgi:hypothetical protein
MNAIESSLFQSCRALVVLTGVSLTFVQLLPAQSQKHSSVNKKPGVEKIVPSVQWVPSYDKFKGRNSQMLMLAKISKQMPGFVMALSADWDSPQQEDKPDGNRQIFNDLLFADSSAIRNPKSEGIILLDGKRRLYLLGSRNC